MACFYPRQAIRLSSINTKTGKSVVAFLPKGSAWRYKSFDGFMDGMPCGQCTGCRLERSRQWAIRMVNESDLHDQNSFITLTFDEPSLLKRERPMSLDKRDFQLFLKRLRFRISDPNDPAFIPEFSSLLPIQERKVLRYFMCGEYGDLFKRPHYHAILFGLDFSDKELYKIKDGMRYYNSNFLSELWPSGFNVITDVTFDSCAYVARYIMKKYLGKDSHKHYVDRIPEYTTMSRRSGIGKEWLVKYLQDVYPRDEIFRRDKKIFCKPPKAYDSYYEVINPEDFSRLKQSRINEALARPKDVQQLIAEQTIKEKQISILQRNLE